MRLQLVTLCVFALLASSCEISDKDRCPKGYDWVEITLSCHPTPEEDTGPEDTGPADTGTGGEDTATEPQDDGPPSGLNEPCADDNTVCESAGYDADFCIINPLEPENAYCSTQDCTDGVCEEGYRCCDCTMSEVLPNENLCLKNPDADLAGGIGGCSCEAP